MHTLPAGLTRLSLAGGFNQPLSGSELPDGLEVLWLGWSFDFVASVRWPSGLKRLYLQCKFSCDQVDGDGLVGNPFPIRLPPSLESLTVGYHFDLPLTAVDLPLALKVLDLGETFDNPIGGEDGDTPLLPDGLEELRLGTGFSHSIENVPRPAGLKRLIMTFRPQSEQGLAGVMWPPGLEELKLDGYFNQPMEGVTFPETLRELSFGWAFAYSLQVVALHAGLARLSFGDEYPGSHILELDWPRSLRSLRVGGARCFCRKALAIWVAQRPQHEAA